MNFVNHENFGETTREWKMNYDPVKTIRKIERYNLPVPPSFSERNNELLEFDELFTKRADFVVLDPVFGDEVESQIKETMLEEIKETLVRKRLKKKLRDEADHRNLVKDIEENSLI